MGAGYSDRRPGTTVFGTRVAGGVLRLRSVRTMPSITVMPMPGQVAEPDAVEEVLAGRVLGLVHEDEIGGAADLDQPAIEAAHPRRVAGGEAEGDLGRHLAERGEQRDHAQDAERLHAGAGRAHPCRG